MFDSGSFSTKQNGDGSEDGRQDQDEVEAEYGAPYLRLEAEAADVQQALEGPQQAEQADEPHGAAAAQEGEGGNGRNQVDPAPFHVLPFVGRGPEVADEIK